MNEELVEEAGQLIDHYFAKAKKLKEWLDNQRRLGVELGHSRSPRGRIRWYELPDPDDPNYREACAQIGRYAGNQPIQSANVDMTKPAMARFYSLVRDGVLSRPPRHDARIVLVIHDEIVVICRSEGQEEIKARLKEAMDWAYSRVQMSYQDKTGKVQTIRLADLLPLTITVDGKLKDTGVQPVAGSYLVH